jgi:DNA polymerase-3 subunit epsilon
MIEMEINGKTYLIGRLTSNGVPIIEGTWDEVWPPGLLTKTQLGEAGYQTGKKLPRPAAALVWTKSLRRGGDGYLYLYNPEQAVPKRKLSAAQRAALEKAQAASNAQWHCSRCGVRLSHRSSWGTCEQCSATLWAEQTIANGTAVIMDTETTGLEPDAEIIELAVINLAGDVLFNQRIQPVNPDAVHIASENGRCAYDIHGISAADLRQAPAFPEVYPALAAALSGQLVLVYNAEFDVPLLLNMFARYQLPPIQFEHDCVMQWYSQYVGEWSSYWGDYKWQPLTGGDHSALGDCRATLEILQRIGEVAQS